MRDEKDVNLEQIQRLAMISIKDVKFLTYILTQENYIQMQEIRKPGSVTTPSKEPFRFHIDLAKIVEMEIEHCCQALYNIIKRRDHETTNNKRMIEKELRVQILTCNMKEHGATEQQLAEVIYIDIRLYRDYIEIKNTKKLMFKQIFYRLQK